ncbi:MAG TPA: UDP-2,3-diacylglucosamine diphosphatase, partial [Coxiellaceae bacterium]|nr:UDP-2,3-diacylglucosamine diphosphatase [Coxiellaceae bacterium]
REATQAEALYILGDFFDAWIGDDDYSPYNQEIIKALSNATRQGLKIYLMIGNRDFLLSSGFANMSGAKLILDPTLINLYGKEVLLTHGDALCTLDTRYQKLRRLTHSSWMQAIALMTPLFIRRYVGKQLRQHSHQHSGNLDASITDVTENAVIAEFQKHEADYMIHGHTHRSKVHTHQLSSGKTVQRIVLDAWFDKANALYWYENDEFELKHFS